MSIYFQRARKDLETPIGVGEKVLFDTHIHNSESLDDSSPLIPTPTEPDFHYLSDGQIDIFRPSTYIVVWDISVLTGHATDGQTFELRKRDYAAEVLDPLGGEVWVPIASSSAAYKVSPSQGNSILLVTVDEIASFGKGTVALFNTSNATVKLTIHPHTKAGLVIFGIGPVDTDISNLYTYVQDLYSFISFSDVHIYRAYAHPFYYRTSGTEPNPNPAQLIPLSDSPDPNFHYQIGVIWSGYTYNFWLISSDPARSAKFTLQGKTTYYLLRAEDFVTADGQHPLTWYQGQVTFGTLWIDDGTYISIPVMLDNSGIYINPLSQIPNIVNAKFTQTLILSPPTSPMPAPPLV